MIKDYFLQNWALILTLAAFAISLKESIFLDKSTIRRMFVLIIMVFLLSIVVFVEFALAEMPGHATARSILMAIRYSATPFIIACVIYTLVKGFRWALFLLAIALTVINIISIFTGIVFRVGEDNEFSRGPLGFLPFIVVAAYSVFMMYILIKHSNKQVMEIVPIAFLGFAFATGLVLPFVYGKAYSQIFCTTIAIALYVYYEFSILMLTKKDALTGLLNRQAYYAFIHNNPESITAMISIDMNGLKAINDSGGHAAGDEALTTLASCFMSAVKSKQKCYRLGGDEFVIVCSNTSSSEVAELADHIRQKVSETTYSCAIGYSHLDEDAASVDDLLKKSDRMMYADKEHFYESSGKDRR